MFSETQVAGMGPINMNTWQKGKCCKMYEVLAAASPTATDSYYKCCKVVSQARSQTPQIFEVHRFCTHHQPERLLQVCGSSVRPAVKHNFGLMGTILAGAVETATLR